jgi:hypothetical protein
MDQIFVINTVQAAAADLSTPGQGKVLVTGDTKGFIREDVDSISVLPHKAETSQIVDVTATASPAANTEYSFRIVQNVDEVQVIRAVHYKTGASAPNASAFGTALAAAAQAVADEGGLQISVAAITSGNGGVKIEGASGYPLVSVVQQSINLTVAAGLVTTGGVTRPIISTGNLAVVSGLTLKFGQSTTAAFEVGQTLYLSGWNSAYVINGKSDVEGTYVRVSAISANTHVEFIAESVSGTIGTATTDLSIIPQEAAGTAAVLAERAITGGGNPNVNIDNTEVYHEVVVSGGQKAGQSKQQKDLAPIVKRYFIADSASIANANDLLVRFKQVNNWLAAGGSFDPLLLS